MLQDKQPAEDCFGYHFYPSDHTFGWGSPRLDVNLRGDPTERHFDPEYLRLRIVELDDAIDNLRVYHPWPGRRQQRVAIGDVVMRDRKEKAVEAFTFGGMLEIERTEACTRCKLTSPVPIIDMRDNEVSHKMFAEEAQALIARRRADWEHDLKRFEARIADAEVEHLYFAILLRLEAEYRRYPKNGRTNVQDFLNFLRSQIELAESEFSHSKLPSDIETIV